MQETVSTILKFVNKGDVTPTDGGGIGSWISSPTGDVLFSIIATLIILGISFLACVIYLKKTNNSFNKWFNTKSDVNHKFAIFHSKKIVSLCFILATILLFSICFFVKSALADNLFNLSQVKTPAYVTAHYDKENLTIDIEDSYISSVGDKFYKLTSVDTDFCKDVKKLDVNLNINLENNTIYNQSVPGSNKHEQNLDENNKLKFSINVKDPQYLDEWINKDTILVNFNVEEYQPPVKYYKACIDTNSGLLTNKGKQILKDDLWDELTDTEYSKEFKEDTDYKTILSTWDKLINAKDFYNPFGNIFSGWEPSEGSLKKDTVFTAKWKEKTAKAVYLEDAQDGINALNFYYDNKNHDEGKVYDVPCGDDFYELPKWLEHSRDINSVYFDSTFEAFRAKSTYKWFFNFNNDAFITIDVKNLNMQDCEICEDMFTGCSNLKKIYSDKSWNIKTLCRDVFVGCWSLVGGNTCKYDNDKVSSDFAKLDYADNEGYFYYSPKAGENDSVEFSYDLNGGTGEFYENYSQSVKKGQSINVQGALDNPPTKENYWFAGWTTKGKSEKKAEYKKGDLFNTSSATTNKVTFYAVWIDSINKDPSQKDNLEYNGQSQNPQWNDFDSTKLNIIGLSPQINAGQYQVKFEPKAGYCWWDGSTDQHTVSWSIDKRNIGKAKFVVNPKVFYFKKGIEQGPQISVTDTDSAGKSIILASDYELNGTQKAVEVGTYSLILQATDNGNYSGKSEEMWRIVESSVKAPVAVSGLIYNGKEQTGINPAESAEQYQISGEVSDVNAGVYSAVATLNPKYAWDDGDENLSKTIKWEISQKDLSDASISLDKDTFEYQDGMPISPKVNVEDLDDQSKSIITENDFEITGDITKTDPGNYKIVIKDTNRNYKGSVERNWKIIEKRIDAPKAVEDLEYDGEYHIGLNPNQDQSGYSLSGNIREKNAGSYQARATLNNGYCWSDGDASKTKILNWNIAKRSLEDASIWLEQDILEYSGKTQSPKVNVSDTGKIAKQIIVPSDYKIDGQKEEINVGEYTLQIVANDSGNYRGEVSLAWKIVNKKVDPPTAIENLVYNGLDQSGTKTDTPEAFVLSGDIYAKNAGQYNLIAKLQNNYEWKDGSKSETKTVSWKISKKQITTAKCSLDHQVFYFKEGVVHRPKVSVVDLIGKDKSIISDDDYTIDGDIQASDLGEYKIFVNASEHGNYTGVYELPWRIVHETQKVDPPVAKTGIVYDGNEHVGVDASQGSEYYTIYGDTKATQAGSYHPVAVLKPDYVWSDGDESLSKTIDWEIGQRDFSNVKVSLDQSIFVYDDGEVIRPKVSVSDEIEKGKQIILDSDYELLGDASASNVGKYNIVVSATELGNYRGLKNLKWEIVPQAIDAPKPMTGLEYDGYEHLGVEKIQEKGYTLGGALKATNAGSYTFNASLKPNYCWKDGDIKPTKNFNWSISKRSIEKAQCSLDCYEFEYQPGVVHKPVLTVSDKNKEGQEIISVQDYVKAGTDSAEAIGEYTISVVSAKDKNYFGHVDIKWSVGGKIVSPPKPAEGIVYDGEQHIGVTPDKPQAGYQLRGEISAKNAGDYTVVATLNDGYKWSDGVAEKSRKICWTLHKRDLSNASIELNQTYFAYKKGVKQGPKVSIKDIVDGKDIITISDYHLDGVLQEENIGDYTLSIVSNENENYQGIIEKKWFIVDKEAVAVYTDNRPEEPVSLKFYYDAQPHIADNSLVMKIGDGTDPEWQKEKYDYIRNNTSIISFDDSFADYKNLKNTSYWFYKFVNAKTIDLKNLCTENVNDMSYMFSECVKVDNILNLNFDTSKVINMESMFSKLGFDGSFENLDLSSFDTLQVLNFSYMFYRCSNLKHIYTDKSWFYGQGKILSASMFEGCTQLIGGNGTSYNQQYVDISMAKLDEHSTNSKLKENAGYYTYANNTSSDVCVIDYDLDGGEGPYENFYQQVKIGSRFTVQGAEALVDPSKSGYKFNGWIVNNQPEKCVFCGEGVEAIDTKLDLKAAWVAQDASAKAIFYRAAEEGYYDMHFAYDNKDYNNDASVVLVYNIDDGSKVPWKETTCASYTLRVFVEPSFASYDKLTSTEQWFDGFTSLKEAHLNYLNTANVTTMSCMFASCTKIKKFDGLESFNTSKVTSFYAIFDDNLKLEELDLRNWDISSCTVFERMFFWCHSLKRVYVNKDWWYEGSKIVLSQPIVYDCNELIGGNGSKEPLIEHFDWAKLDYYEKNRGQGFFTYKGDDECRLEYDLNGGTGSQYDNYFQCVPQGKMFTVQGENKLDIPKREGFAFVGWKYNGNIYDSNSYVPAVGQHITLIAQWEHNDKWAKALYYAPDGSKSGKLKFVYDKEKYPDATKVFDVGDGRDPEWQKYDDIKKNVSIINFDLSFQNCKDLKYMKQWFMGFKNPQLSHVDLTNVKTLNLENTNCMFALCDTLDSVYIDNFDITNVKDFSGMFSGCINLKKIYCSKAWEIKEHVGFAGVFTACNSLKGGNGFAFKHEDESRVKEFLHPDCSEQPGYFTYNGLEKIDLKYDLNNGQGSSYENYVQSVEKGKSFTVQSATKLDDPVRDRYAFFGWSYDGKLYKAGDLINTKDIAENTIYLKAEWKEMKAVAYYTEKDKTLSFYYETSDTEREGEKFYIQNGLNPGWKEKSFTKEIDNIYIDPEFAKYDRLISIHRWFSNVNAKTIDCFNINTKNVSNMEDAFKDCQYLENINFYDKDGNTSFVTTKSQFFKQMFMNDVNLKTLDIHGFRFNNTYELNCMFENCSSLKHINMPDEKGCAKHVEYLSRMFCGCKELREIDLSFLEGANNIQSMSEIFCMDAKHKEWPGHLQEVKFPHNLSTHNLTNLSYAFYGCVSLVLVDISPISVENVEDFSFMFEGCINLITIFSKHDWGTYHKADAQSGHMFDSCWKLTGGNGFRYQYGYHDISMAHFDNYDNEGYFTYGGKDIDDVVSLTYVIREDQSEQGDQYNNYSQSVKFGQSFTVQGASRLSDPKKEGYKFLGWTDEQDSKTVKYVSGSALSTETYPTKKDIKLWPVWENVTVCAVYYPAEKGMNNAHLDFVYKNKIPNSNEDAIIFPITDGTNPDWQKEEYDFIKSSTTSIVIDEEFGFYNQVRSTKDWFKGFSNSDLNMINLSVFNMDKVQDVTSMFENCSHLKEIDFGLNKFPNLKNTSYLFAYSKNLNRIYSSIGWENIPITSHEKMFIGCTSLIGGNGYAKKDTVVEDARLACLDCAERHGLFSYNGGEDQDCIELEYILQHDEKGPQYDDYKQIVKKNSGLTCQGASPLALPTKNGYCCVGWALKQGASATNYIKGSTINTGQETPSIMKLYPVWKDATAKVTWNNCNFQFHFDNDDHHEAKYCFDLGDGTNPEWQKPEYASIKNITTNIGFDEQFGGCADITSFKDWFNGFSNNTITITNLENLMTSNVKDMSNMFKDFKASNLDKLNLTSFDMSSVENLSHMFSGANMIQEIIFSESLNLSKVKDMSYMFSDCLSLNEAIIYSIENTKALTNIEGMFACSKGNVNSLERVIFSQGFDVLNVTNASKLFQYCSKLRFIEGLHGWDTGNFNNVNSMFEACGSLESIDVHNFNVSNVVNFNNMFKSCSMLKTIYSQDNWSNFIFSTNSDLVSSNDMFAECPNLFGGNYYHNFSDCTIKFANVDRYHLKGFFTYGGEGIDDMVKLSYNLNYPEHDPFKNVVQTVKQGNSFTVQGATPIDVPLRPGYKFKGWVINRNYHLFPYNKGDVLDTEEYQKEIQIEGLWEPEEIVNKAKAVYSPRTIDSSASLNFYYDDQSHTEIPGSIAFDINDGKDPGWQKPEYAYISQNVEQINIDASMSMYDGLKSTSKWFYNFHNNLLNEIDVFNLNTTNVSDMSYMFANTEHVNKILFNNSFGDTSFYTDNVLNFEGMFKHDVGQPGCMISLDLSNFNFNQAENISYMFENCQKLTEVLFEEEINNNKGIKLNNLFNNCRSLANVNIASFNLSNLNDMSYMFNNCSSLRIIDLTNIDASGIQDLSYTFNNCSKLTTIYASQVWEDECPNAKCDNIFTNCIKICGGDFFKYHNDGDSSLKYARHDAFGVNGYFVYSGKDYALLNYDLNGGTGTEYDKLNQRVKYGEYFTVQTKEHLLPPRKYEHICTGWALDKSAMHSQMVVGQPLSSRFAKHNKVTLYAVWKEGRETAKAAFYLRTLDRPAELIFYFDKDSHLEANKVYQIEDDINPGWLKDDEVKSTTEKVTFSASFANTKNIIKSSNSWFKDFENLKEVNCVNFNVSQVEDATMMFKNCSSLSELDLSRWKFNSLENAESMFENCSKLKRIYAANDFTNDNIKDQKIFINCQSLIGGNGYKQVDTSAVQGFYAVLDDADNKGYLTYGGLDINDAITVRYQIRSDEAGDNYKEYFQSIPRDKAFTIQGGTRLVNPYKKDYTCVGWSTDPEGKKNIYKIGEKYKTESTSPNNILLYAVWDKASAKAVYERSSTPHSSTLHFYYDCYSHKEDDNIVWEVGDGTNPAWRDEKYKDLMREVSNVSIEREFSDYDALVSEKDWFKGFDQEWFTLAYCPGAMTANLKSTENMFKNCKYLKTIYASEDWYNPIKDINSKDMFDACYSLRGGNNCKFIETETDISMAKLDCFENSGYLTCWSFMDSCVKLNYNLNGGESEYYKSFAQQVKNGWSFTVQGNPSIPDPEKPGYNFKGWSLNQHALSGDYKSGDKLPSIISGETEITLYAVFVTVEAKAVFYEKSAGNIGHLDFVYDDLSYDDAKYVFKIGNGSNAPWQSDSRLLVKIDTEKINFMPSFLDYDKLVSINSWFKDFNNPNLESINFSNIDLSHVTNADYAFQCSKVKNIIFDTSKTFEKNISFCGMCSDCEFIEKFDVGTTNVDVANISEMFNNCPKLSKIYASKNFVEHPYTDDDKTIFSNCKKLVGGNGLNWDESISKDIKIFRIDDVESPGLFTYGGCSADDLFVVNYFIDESSGEQGPAYKEYSQQVQHNRMITVQGYTKLPDPGKQYYEFVGWSTDKTSTTPEYLPGDNIGKKTEEHYEKCTLYPVWKSYLLAVAVYQEDIDGLGSLNFYYDNEAHDEAMYKFYIANGVNPEWKNDWFVEHFNKLKSINFDESFKRYDGITSTENWFSNLLSPHIKTFDMNNLNVVNIETMSCMFKNSIYLQEVTFAQELNYKNCRSFKDMFSGCSNLNTVWLSYSHISNADVSGMYKECRNLKRIYWEKIDEPYTKECHGDNVFTGDINLIGGNGFDYSSVIFDDCRYLTLDNYENNGFLTFDWQHSSNFTKLRYEISDGEEGEQYKNFEQVVPKLDSMTVQGATCLKDPINTKEPNKSFSGWSTEKDAGGVIYNTGDEFITDYYSADVVTLYPVWKEYKAKAVITQEMLEYKMTFYFDDKEHEGLYVFDVGDGSKPAWQNESLDDIRPYIGEVVFDNSFAHSHNIVSTKDWFKNFGSNVAVLIVDINNLYTDKLLNSENMFMDCISLSSIKTTQKEQFSNVKNSNNMFVGCSALQGGNGTKFNIQHVNAEYAHLDTPSQKGYFTYGGDDIAQVEYIISEDERGEQYKNFVQKVKLGDGVVVQGSDRLDNPSKEGFIFCGWSRNQGSETHDWKTGDILITKNKEEKNIKLYPVWINNKAKAVYKAPSDNGSGKLEFYYDDDPHVEGTEVFYVGSGYVTAWLKKEIQDSVSIVQMHESFYDYKDLKSTRSWFSGFKNQDFISIDLSYLCTDNINDMSSMFYDCINLKNVIFSSSQKMANVSKTSAMFENCSSMKVVDLSYFDMYNLKIYDNMFKNCLNLKQIYTGDYNLTSNGSGINMFYGCNNLRGGNGWKYADGQAGTAFATVDCREHAGYFTYYGKGVTDNKVIRYCESSSENSIIDIYDYIQSVPPSMSFTIQGTDKYPDPENDKVLLGWCMEEDKHEPDYKAGDIIEAKKLQEKVTILYPAWKLWPKAVFSKPAPSHARQVIFYYDTIKHSNDNGFEKIFDISEDIGYPAWANMEFAQQTVRAEFDSSFKDFHGLRSINAWFRFMSAKSIVLTNIDASNIWDFSYLFNNSAVEEVTFASDFNASNASDLHSMFWGSIKLKVLNGFDRFTSPGIKDIGGLFNGVKLTSIDMSFLRSNHFIEGHRIFENCYSLTTIYANSEWIFDKHYEPRYSCFGDGLFNLVGGEGSKWSVFGPGDEYARIDKGSQGKPGYFTYKARPNS